MKKMLTLAMLFVLATSAMAQFKYSGTMRIRGNVNNMSTFVYPNYRFGDSFLFSATNAATADNGLVKHYWTYDDTLNVHYFKSAKSDTMFAENRLPTEKFIDMRFRPTLEYKVNDNINAVWTAEIGDINFGNSSKGGAQGADGLNVETKNLYFDWIFYPGQKVRAGIQNYMDPMVLVVEDDFAGVTLESNWEFANLPELTTKAGWLKGNDKSSVKKFDGSYLSSEGTSNVNGTDYSYGYSNYIFDASYALNLNNKVGVNVLYQNKTEAIPADEWFDKYNKSDKLNIDLNQYGTWIAPYFKGRPLYDLSVEAEFVINMRSAEYELKSGTLKDTIKIGTRNHLFSMPEIADEFGMAFMGKVNYKVTPDLDFGLNLLYASGKALPTSSDSIFYVGPKAEGWTSANNPYGKYMKHFDRPTEYYKGASSFAIMSKQTTTGLEILGTAGVNDSRGLSPAFFGDYFGTIMPVVYGNFKLTKNYSIGVTAGAAMLPEDIYYMTIDENSKTHKEKDNLLGYELDLNANLMFNDKLNIRPVAAFFFPGDMIQVGKPGTGYVLGTLTETQTAPMFYEIGLKAEYRF